MAALAILKDVTRTYRSGERLVHALRGVSLEVRAGDLLAIVGTSGSGKTTCANMLGCLDRPTSGRCEIAGVDTSTLDTERLALVRREAIGFVFQGFQLLPRLTALGNVELPLAYRGVSRRGREERARQALVAVGLADRAAHLPSQLSGGQQQRVGIARAIVAQPRMLIADEPTAALDPDTATDVMGLLEGLNQNLGIAIVIITHDMAIAKAARKIIHIEAGRISTRLELEEGGR
jgi:putative ABC transport system ATP-binding protein